MALLWKKSGGIYNYADDVFHILQKNFSRAFDTFVDEKFPAIKNGFMAWRPHVDLKETKNEYILKADIPGVEKKDLHVTLNDDVLSIRGERNVEEKKQDETHHWTERFHGKFERSFSVPHHQVDHSKIEAKFDNGVLTIVLKKKKIENGRSKDSEKKVHIE